MIKKISMLAVLAAAIALVLAGCVKAPASPVAGSLTGTWKFQDLPVGAMIGPTADDGSAPVTVTVGDGTLPISKDPRFAKITKVVVMCTLTEDAEEMTFSLTLAGADPISVMLVPTISPDSLGAEETVHKAAVRTVIEAAQGGTVTIALDTSGVDTMTVSGSFIDTLIQQATGAPMPAGGLTAIRIG